MEFLCIAFGVTVANKLGAMLPSRLAGATAALEPLRAPARVVVLGFMAVILLVGVGALTAAAVRRTHDLGFSGWWTSLLLVPFLNVLAALILCLMPGADGPNRFGDPPGPGATCGPEEM